MSWAQALGAFVGSLAAMAIVCATAFGLCSVMFSSKLSRIEEGGPLVVGQRIRFLCSIPEQKIEAGEVGLLYLILPGDDSEYWFRTEDAPARRAMLFADELWQIERL